MSRLDPLESRVARSWPPAAWSDVTVVIGVSGGADSTALLRCLARLKGPGPGLLIAAHYHHGLRGAAADADAQFVAQLAAELALPWEIGRALPHSADDSRPRRTSEATARQARYAFLRETAHRRGARYVALAHSADDQAETVLHRLLRGTGLAGLAGIPRLRRLSRATTVIRPLLDISRADLRAYLGRLNQPYCEDETNVDLRFTRNRIRQSLLPHLKNHYNRQVAHALTRLASQAAEVRQLIEPLIADLARQAIVRREPGLVELDPASLAAQPRYLVCELLTATWRELDWPAQGMTTEHWRELAGIVASVPADAATRFRTTDFPGGIAVRCAPGGRLTLERRTGR